MRSITLYLYITRSLALIVMILIGGCVLIDPFLVKEGACEKITTACQLQQADIGAMNLEKGKPVDVEICACRPWNSSGIKVTAGEKYIFEVTNISECWQDKKTKSDPRIGWIDNDPLHNLLRYFLHGNTRTEVADIYALVGTVGKNDKNAFAVFNNNPDSTIHECGESYSYKNNDPITIMIGKDEELFFYANDREGYYYNNKGILNLRVIKVEDSNEKASFK